MSNKQFEVSYIISLTILILTFLMVPYLKKFLSEFVAYIFLLMVSIHIVIFNTSYTFKISSFNVSAIQKLDYISRITLIVVFFSFLYVLFHILITFFLNQAVIKIFNFNVSLSLIVPLIVVLLIAGLMIIKILNPAFLLRKVKIVIIPKRIEVYSNYEDGTPIFIKIENRSKQTLHFDIDISFPDGVYFKIDFETPVEKIKKFNKQIKIHPEKVWMRHIKIRHEVKETITDLVNIKIKYRNNTYEEDIEAILKAQ